MNCPVCQQWAKRKAETRQGVDADGWSVITRTRVCPNGHRFMTYECYEYADVEVVFRVRELLVQITDALDGGDTDAAQELILSAHGFSFE
jgi:transcriptional regulator NrdR family protein